VENDVDVDVYLTTVPTQRSTTGFFGIQTVAIMSK
jgi:hypothetical protein